MGKKMQFCPFQAAVSDGCHRSEVMELGQSASVLLLLLLLLESSRCNYSQHTVFSPNEPLTLRHINEAPHS